MDVVQKNIKLNLYSDCMATLEIVKPLENRYDIVFESENTYSLEKELVGILENQTGSKFETYIKLFQVYSKSKTNQTLIKIDRAFKRDLKPIPEYSFIFGVSPQETSVVIAKKEYTIIQGDLLVFNTQDFVKDTSKSISSILVIGSLSNKISSKSTSLI